MALLYWFLLYPAADVKRGATIEIGALAFHGPVALLMLIDFGFSRVVFGLRHIIFNACFFLLYLTNNLIFTFSTGKPLYEITDYINKPSKAVRITLISMFASFFLFVLFWALHICKTRFLYYKRNVDT